MAEKGVSARLRRGVQENNLFLVKRLIQRTDMRNPDPDPRRYTSLAWAAVLGHEETFEFLLNEGHDDNELSKDAENNTILMLLADLQLPAANPYCADPGHPDLMGAALRMAQAYYYRYPYMLEWSDVQGKTALHIAALKGNDSFVQMLLDIGADYDLEDNLGNTALHYASAWGHIPVVKLLIERGCSFAARNHEGFTASDYAYSNHTMATLQNTALSHFEAKKNRRRRYQHATYRGQDWTDTTKSSSRLRSDSGGSRTTATSDSGDTGTPSVQQPASSFSSSSSYTPSGSNAQLPPRASPSLSHSTSFSTFSPMPSYQSSSISSLTAPSMNPASVLSPIASRVLERDADAIAEYKKRNRSGSAGTQASDSKPTSNGASGLPTLPTINGSTTHLPFTPTAPKLPLTLADRRLRPSFSAAQLRSSPPPQIPVVATPVDPQTPRSRAGTNPTSSRPNQAITSPIESIFPAISSPLSGNRIERQPSNRRVGTLPLRRPSQGGDFTGPSSEYAIFPEPPPNFGNPEPPTPPATSKSSAARRAAFALLSKPLPSIDSQRNQREHRRGTSASEVRG